MEPIQSTLKKWMRESKNFQEHYRKLRQEVLSDPDIRNLINQHQDLTDASIEKQLMKLYEYHSQSKKCEKCPSLGNCVNLVKGYIPNLQVQNGDIRLTYEMCSRKKHNEEQAKKKSFIQSLYMPKEIVNASFDKIELDDHERFDAIRHAKEYVQAIGTADAQKGLYLYGPFGVGKTYLLGAMANKLAEYGIATTLIYMPEFVREMKSSLKDASVLNERMDHFKQTPVLMIDDIGAESQSAWFRDEILGSILQYRMMERLPVFFTSNYSLGELEKHLATSTRGDVDQLKAGRIIERIKQVSKPISTSGKNRRS